MDKDLEAIRAEMNALRNDLSGVMQTLREIGEDRGGAIYERLRQSADRARQEGYRRAEGMAHEVERHPFTSLASAFGIGLLLGLLFGGGGRK